MRKILLALFVIFTYEIVNAQDSINLKMHLVDHGCVPCSEGLLVFYDIDGLVRNCKEIASSPQYCEIYTNNVDGVDLDYAYKKRRVKVLKVGRRQCDTDDIYYLSRCDNKEYGFHGYYYDNDSVEKRYLYFKFRTKLPMVINGKVLLSFNEKKETVRSYNYNNLTFYYLEPDKAKLLYGRKARFGALIVTVK